MHFIVVVFSDECSRNLIDFPERFGHRLRSRSFDLNGPSLNGWFVSKDGVRTNSGFARELHFGAVSNRAVAEKISLLPEYVCTPQEICAAVSSMLNLTPFAFVSPNGDWVGTDDVGCIAFFREYKTMVSFAKRRNYYVTALDCIFGRE